jgi:hypothetical protein
MPTSVVEQLFAAAHERQQRQVTRTLDFTREFALAAGTVAGLTARLDFAGLGHIAAQGVDVLIIEALPFRAVHRITPTSSPSAAIITAFTLVAVPIITVPAIPAKPTTIFSVHVGYPLFSSACALQRAHG